MKHFYDHPNMGENWFTYPNLYSYMVKYFPSGSHFVEVGSWKGKSSAFMAVEIINSEKNIIFDCVDIWQDSVAVKSGEKNLMDIFLENIDPVKNIINVFQSDSVAASLNYEDNSLDFVFIDGDHSYEGVTRDILAYLPKMKPNSIISGHDYGWSQDIRKAVADIFGSGNHGDPWNSGCFIFDIVDGSPQKFTLK